jgi:hypothetical protein
MSLRNFTDQEHQELGALHIIIGQYLIRFVSGTTKLHGLSPRANYTDQATAVSRRSDCQLFTNRGCHVVSVTDPYGRILAFLDMSSYFSIK